MLALSFSHSFPVPIPIPHLYPSRTPSGIERTPAMRGIYAFPWQKYARHTTEPRRALGKGPESNSLVDRTLPAGPYGSVGARHITERKE